MAQFDANINLNVENRNALKGVTQVEGGINKLIKGVKEFERVFNEALNPKKIQSRFQLDQERKALTLFNQQNEALTKQFRLAAQLGRAYDKLQVKVVGTELRRLERARTSQRALPGGRSTDQKRLPAAGQTSGTQFGGDITAAVRAEARVREAVLAEAERQLQADKRATAAKEKIARAAQGEVSATSRTPGAPQPFGLLEPARGQRTTSAPVGSSGGSRYQQRLQAEVDRQIRVTGKLSNEILETVAKYNKVQTSADRLVKTQGRLSTKLSKAAKTGGGSGARKGGGGGGAGGGLAAGIGFPLLFGGGPGSVIGGAVGSAGGFGTQILASAIGGIIDQAIASVAKLGQALNPLTADIDAVVAAAGESSTAFGQLIKDLEKVAGKEAALAAATAQLVNVIGQDGVSALRRFGADTTALGEEVSIALTQAAGAVAELINNLGFLEAVIGSIQQDNLSRAAKESSDPEIKRLREERKSIATNDSSGLFGDFFGDSLADKLAAQDKLIAARQLELQLTEEQNIKDEAGVVAAEAKAAASNVEINSLKAQIALEESGLDLTTEAGVALAEKVIEQQTYVALQAAINSGLSTEAILLNETLQKLQLKARAVAEREAAQRKAEAAARKAANEQKRLAREAEQARKKELRVKQTLAQLDIKSYNVAIQTIQATEGEAAAIKEQLSNMDALLAKRIQVINLSDKDQRIKDKEIAIAREQVALEQVTLRNKNQEIALQKELNKLKAAQQIEAVQTGLDQELAGLSLGGNDQTDLLQEQANRYANTLKDINNQIEQQNLLIENTPTPNQEAINAATAQLDVLQKTKAAYEAMLPQIFAAEQAQLKYNQAFAAITPAVNSLVGGLREVVAGTKTAEEAFADFLNTIADQLIQTAATMIAQYIAIGIARQFAGLGGNPGGGSSGFNLSGGGSSVGSGGLPGIDSLGGLFNGALPFIGVDALATGGTANGGQPYIVGEEGPELFIPGVTGTVSNNDQFEAARNALIDNSTGEALIENEEALGVSSSNISNQGGNSSSNNSSSQDSSTSNYYNQNGSALAAISRSFAENNSTLSTSSSVMRDRSMERESQTTLGSGGSMTIETQVINEVEYATVDQVAKASALAAKQARAQVFSDMKNKPSRRAAVGLK